MRTCAKTENVYLPDGELNYFTGAVGRHSALMLFHAERRIIAGIRTVDCVITETV